MDTTVFYRMAATAPSVYIVTVTLGHVETMCLDTIVVFDAVVTFVIPLVASLTSSHVMWRSEHV
jgi:hypothetical protein